MTIRFTQPDQVAPYLKDASQFSGTADQVFLPENEKEISEILKEANAGKIPVTVSAGRTGLTGAAVPLGGWVLSIEKLSKIIEVRSSSGPRPSWARTEPALLLKDLDRVLEPEGRGLIHSIGHLRPDPLNAWIEKRIFPGAYPPSLREMLEVLEPCSFAVLDVENLRLHYALTLEHWLRRFDDARERVREMYDERFVRAWRLYLCGAQAAFRAGEMQLFQVLFARGRSNRVPWTRAGLYDWQERQGDVCRDL